MPPRQYTGGGASFAPAVRPHTHQWRLLVLHQPVPPQAAEATAPICQHSMYLGRRCILSGTIIDLSMEAFDIICSILEYAPDAAAAAFQEGGAEAMNAKDLGRRLRSAREARGLSQQAVAHALSLPRTAVTQLEAGSRSVSTSN